MSSRIKMLPTVLLTLTSFLLNVNTSPVYNMQPAYITANIGTTGRNIRNLPCISRKTNQSGVCMFAIDCLKANGTHLGTCIDRFYFGSCCHVEPVHEIIDNSIETSIFPGREPPNRVSSTTQKITTTTAKPATIQENSTQPLKTTQATTTQRPIILTKEPMPSDITELSYRLTTFQSVDGGSNNDFPTTLKPVRSTLTTTSAQKHSSYKPTVNNLALNTSHSDADFIAQQTTSKPILAEKTPFSNTTSPILSQTKFTSTEPAKRTQTTVKPILNHTTPNISKPFYKPVSVKPSSSIRPFKPVEWPSTVKPSSSKRPAQTIKPITRPHQNVSKPVLKPTHKPTRPKPTASVKPTKVTKFPSKPALTSKQPVKPVKQPTKPVKVSTRRPATKIPPIVKVTKRTTTHRTTTTTLTTSSPTTRVETTQKAESTRPTAITYKVPLTETASKVPVIETISKVPTVEVATQVTWKITETTPIIPGITTNSPTTAPKISNFTMTTLETTLQMQASTAETPEISESTPTTEATTKAIVTVQPVITPSSETTSVNVSITQKVESSQATSTPKVTPQTSSVLTEQSTESNFGLLTTVKPAVEMSMIVADNDTKVEGNEVLENNNTIGVNGNVVTNEIESEKPAVLESTTKPNLVTWTVPIEEHPANVFNSTDEDWVPITTPDGWVLLPSVTTSSEPSVPTLTTIPPVSSSTQETNQSSTTEKVAESTSVSTLETITQGGNYSGNTTESSETASADASTETGGSTTTELSLEKPVNMSDFTDVCGRRMYPEGRIVGGEKSPYGKWPWQISLRQWRTSTYLHKCGAALLNENWAITAAHCVDNVPPSDLLLRLGEHDLSTESEPYLHQERRVQIVASHPQFDPRTFEYDLALLRFYEPVKFQPNIIPVCVPQTDENFVGRTAYVTGWGRLYEDGPLPSVLQEVSVPVINNTLCESMYRMAGYIEHIPHIFICAGWRRGGFDSCEGDSGGPMVIQRPDKRFLLAGVISWGIGCAEPNQPGVYTRISEFRDWINQILQF